MSIVHLTDRAVLHVGYAEARPFLQGLLTNDLEKLAPDRPQWTALLSSQGKVLFDMILFNDGAEGVLIDVEAARADDLARRLTIYRLRREVAVTRTDRQVFAAWDEPTGWAVDPRLAALGTRSVGAGAADVDLAMYHMRRRRLGVAEGSGELGVETTLWLEANAVELNGVSFAKGCYVGQENTARMHHRDRVRRRLLPVALSAPPGGERAIMAGEKLAGELRAFEGDVGMAHMRMELAGGELRLGGAGVTVLWPGWLADWDLHGSDGVL